VTVPIVGEYATDQSTVNIGVSDESRLRVLIRQIEYLLGKADRHQVAGFVEAICEVGTVAGLALRSTNARWPSYSSISRSRRLYRL